MKLEKLPELGKIVKGLRFHPSVVDTPQKYFIYYIYQITNNKNGKVYVGQTKDLIKRIKDHKGIAGMLRNKHKFGDPYYWEVKVLDIVKFKNAKTPYFADKVIDLENFYIKKAQKIHGKKCVNKRIFKMWGK